MQAQAEDEDDVALQDEGYVPDDSPVNKNGKAAPASAAQPKAKVPKTLAEDPTRVLALVERGDLHQKRSGTNDSVTTTGSTSGAGLLTLPVRGLALEQEEYTY